MIKNVLVAIELEASEHVLRCVLVERDAAQDVIGESRAIEEQVRSRVLDEVGEPDEEDGSIGATARSQADAPEIDCAVRVKGKSLAAGDFVRAKVAAADGYDLIARALGRPW